jgi:CRP/FNR family transcriptional regulator, cyclic AMP receptor protein
MAAGLFYEIDLFKDVDESCLQVLLRNSRALSVGVGHLFFSAGQTGGELFFLEKGSVQMFRACGERKIAIATLRAPAVFGEMGCFGQGIHCFSAESVSESQVRLIPADTIRSLMECSPNLAHEVMGLISERFDRFLHEFEAQALKGTIPRVAALLLKKKEEDVVRGLTHKNLAAELGIHRESVTVALGELQKAGIIAIARKKISILQQVRLERASHE